MNNNRSYPDIIIHVVLPCFNEEANLERLIIRIDESMHYARWQYRCLIVDDGSTDGTREIVERLRKSYPITAIYHPVNRGLGATIRTGLTEVTAMAADSDVVVTMDGDDTHTPGLISRMARMLNEGYDVVIASRFQPNAQVRGVPFPRQVLSWGASALFRVLFPISGVKDYTCGYRAYRASVLKEAFRAYGDNFLSQDGFQCMVDILLWLRKLDAVIGETPMVLRYDFKGGQSKMKVLETIKKTLKLIALRLHS